MTYLTEHFTLEEVTQSSTASRFGINNSLPSSLMGAVTNTAKGMERVRAFLGNLPISVDSWYRCPELNLAVNSKLTSQHLKGEAVDFICPSYGTPLAICKRLIAMKDLVKFDQLILEHTWVHISWNADPNVPQKGQVLSLLTTGGYATGLTDRNGVSYGA
jgi:zinc D-Ala-D-Ala carboxypeptidase